MGRSKARNKKLLNNYIMKLISMTDFVLKRYADRKKSEKEIKRFLGYDAGDFLDCLNYANFLKQPLELWMFIPCDEKGNVLKEPLKPHTCSSENAGEYWSKYENKLKQYNEAKDRVLFEGFTIDVDSKNEIIFNISINEWDCQMTYYKEMKTFCLSYSPYDIDSLYKVENFVGFNLTLTESAIKQLGL